MRVAFAPAGSVEEAAAAMTALGLHPGEPRALGRQLELPEGTVVPRFSLLSLPPDETPALDCFVCGHLTPELVRRPEWLAHPNGASGVQSLHLIVEDTAALLPAYDRLFGLHEVTTTDAVACVRVGPHRILFSTAGRFRDDASRHRSRPGFPGARHRRARTRDRRYRADRRLPAAQWQVAFDALPDGRLAVPAREANGTILFFTEA